MTRIHALFFFGLVCLSGCAALAEPVIEGPSFISLGYMPANGMISGTLLFRNIGDEPLQLLSAARSCMCVEVKVPTEQCSPGAVMPVEFTIDPRKAKAAGVQLSVKTNAPATPVFPVEIRWRGGDLYMLYPTCLYLRKTPEVTVSEKITIYKSATCRFNFTGVRSNTPGLTAAIESDADRKAVITVAASGDFPDRRRTSLSLDCDAADFKEIELPVVVEPVRWCEPFPESIYTRVARSSPEPVLLSAKCILRTKEYVPLTITAEPPCFEPVETPQTDSGGRTIQLRYYPERAHNEFGDLIRGRLSIRGPEELKTVTVPFTCVLFN